MTDALLHPLATALDGTGRLVAAVTEEQWALPTPCSDWTVRRCTIAGPGRVAAGTG